MTSTRRVIVAIPAYNCAPQLPRTLGGIDSELAGLVDEFWVIDNGSTDGTVAAALKTRAELGLTNVRVFVNDQNVNLGGTHKNAFLAAAAQGKTHVVILHGDDQASTVEIKDLLARAEADGVGTVLGSRFSRGSRLLGYNKARIAGNRVLNLAYSVVAGRKLEDLGSGLNLFSLSDLDESTFLQFGNSLTFNYELILDLVRRRVRFSYEPITWRETDQVSNARNWRVFSTALKILFAWRLGRRTTTSTSGQPTHSSWTEQEPLA